MSQSTLPDAQKPSLISRLIKYMIIGAMLAMAYVILKSCSTPKIGLSSYAQGTLSKLEVKESPPMRPSTVFTGPNGDEMTLADFEGQVILVNLWATWCAPCVAEMPSLSKLKAHYDAQDVNFDVVAISVDRTREEAAQFLTELDIENLGLYHDKSFAIARAAGARGLPVSILYNENGRELARLSGEADWNSEEAKALIDSVLRR